MGAVVLTGFPQHSKKNCITCVFWQVPLVCLSACDLIPSWEFEGLMPVNTEVQKYRERGLHLINDMCQTSNLSEFGKICSCG